MAVYSVLEPPVDGDSLKHAERTTFVREAFGWSAFVFGPLWLLRHRMWLAVVVYATALTALIAGAAYLRIANDVAIPLALLAGLLIGLEAAPLRRRSLLRRGWRDRGFVVGGGRAAAEQRYFDHRLANGSAPRSHYAPPPHPTPPASARDIIGLFPEPGGSR